MKKDHMFYHNLKGKEKEYLRNRLDLQLIFGKSQKILGLVIIHFLQISEFTEMRNTIKQ